MTVDKEFIINEFITVKLEGSETVIYVGDKRFDQCKILLLNIPIDDIENFDELESIDEVAEMLNWDVDHGQEGVEYDIAPDTEFFGHCSNLQAWYEQDYNTNLLHSSLAFPLLKKLTKIGDPLAKRVFKEEIVKRLESGHLNVILYLIEMGYLDYIKIEDQELFKTLRSLITSILQDNKKFFEYTDIIIDIYIMEALEVHREFDEFLGEYKYEDAIAFPILKKFTEVGGNMAYNLFRGEIIRKFSTCHLNIINDIIIKDYLSFLYKTQLLSVIQTFLNNFDKINFDEPRVFYKLMTEIKRAGLLEKNFSEFLNLLEKFHDNDNQWNLLMNFLKDYLISVIIRRDWDAFSYLFNPILLKVFNHEELEKFFDNFDYNSYLFEYTGFKRIKQLKKIASLGINKAKELLRNEVFIFSNVDAVILKNLADNGEKEAEKYLQRHMLRLITICTDSIIKFLNIDVFLNSIKDLTTEMQLYLVLSPEMNYLQVSKHLESPKIEDLVNADAREDFIRIITYLQKNEEGHLHKDDIELLKEILLSFGTDAFRGLIGLYSRDTLKLQLLAIECILSLYKHHKNLIKNDIVGYLRKFFRQRFKPYFKSKNLGEVHSSYSGVKEYKEILTDYKAEYTELKIQNRE